MRCFSGARSQGVKLPQITHMYSRVIEIILQLDGLLTVSFSVRLYRLRLPSRTFAWPLAPFYGAGPVQPQCLANNIMQVRSRPPLPRAVHYGSPTAAATFFLFRSRLSFSSPRDVNDSTRRQISLHFVQPSTTATLSHDAGLYAY